MNLNPNHLVLGSALSAYRRAVLVTFMFSLVVNLLVLAGPLYMLQVFDRVLTSGSTDTLVMLSVIGVAALLTMALIEMVRARITVKLSAWLDKALSSTLFEGSVYKSLANTSAPSTQSLRDLRSMRAFISSPQLFAFFDAPWAPFFILVMFFLHPYLGMVALGGAVVLFTLALLNEWCTRRPSREDGGASIAAMNIADATVRNADSVSAMGMMPAMRGRWMEASVKSRANQVLSEKRTSLIVAVSKFARMVLQMMILGVGAWLALGGELTPGAMIAGSILMSRALAPVEQAIGAWRMMIGARQSYQRVREHILTQPVVPESMELPAPQGKLTVSSVSYMVEGQREPILRNISFALEPGESMALIGPSGSGKSTLARLLLGNAAPKTGHVRLDGMDVSAWAPDQLGPHCGYLPQDIELFGGTVKDNIARMGEAVPEHVISAAQMAGCHELILALPDGYETQVGDRGSALSGGTRQRIGLARALYGNPKLIVLDEPNSNLDGQGEAALFEALKALKQQLATVVIIGHRQSTLDHVDKVLTIKDGMVQSFGTKDEILDQLGVVAPATNTRPKIKPAAVANMPPRKTTATQKAAKPVTKQDFASQPAKASKNTSASSKIAADVKTSDAKLREATKNISDSESVPKVASKLSKEQNVGTGKGSTKSGENANAKAKAPVVPRPVDLTSVCTKPASVEKTKSPGIVSRLLPKNKQGKVASHSVKRISTKTVDIDLPLEEPPGIVFPKSSLTGKQNKNT